MVEPGSTPARLAGLAIRELTPALPGEQIDIGPHGLLVEAQARREEREQLHAQRSSHHPNLLLNSFHMPANNAPSDMIAVSPVENSDDG